MKTAVVFALLAAAAQAPQTPHFEVASIKRTGATERGGGSAGLQAGGRFVMTNGPARVLLNMAYPNQTREIAGAPSWVTYENYDVDARAAGNVSQDQLALMLRDLLADRFKLAAHFEALERPMYELRIARADGVLGPNFRPSAVDCLARFAVGKAGTDLPARNGIVPCTTQRSHGLMESGGITMAALVTWLPAMAGLPVIDKTGLPGTYEFVLRYADNDPAAGAASADPLPSLFTAMQEQLGLKLEAVRAPTPVLVIDHIERPTGN